MTGDSKRKLAERWRDLYLKIGATGPEIREQSEDDWLMCAEVLGVSVPVMPESREMIAKMVEAGNG